MRTLSFKYYVLIPLVIATFAAYYHRMASTAGESLADRQVRWRKALAELPDSHSGAKIPAFFFAHGSPILIWPTTIPAPVGRMETAYRLMGPHSRLGNFLKDFGPTLVEKYRPRAIVVFSAHWETSGETLVTDYGEENPLLYDYYGFDPAYYEVGFKSKGDSAVSQQVVDVLNEAGIKARTTPTSERRGRDGRGFMGPGFDHGVFVPFRLMFGESTDIPVVEVSIDESLDPLKNWALGKGVDKLRSDGILILSGGLTIHTFKDMAEWNEETASKDLLDFHQEILDAVNAPPAERQSALVNLTKHRGFRKAHPREEHFIPLYVAAGAGEGGETRVLSDAYGAPTFAFGV